VSVTNAKCYPQENIKEWLEQISYKNVEDPFKSSLWYVLKIGKNTVGFSQFDVTRKELYQMQADTNYQEMG
jgi:hypothetical protein